MDRRLARLIREIPCSDAEQRRLDGPMAGPAASAGSLDSATYSPLYADGQRNVAAENERDEELQLLLEQGDLTPDEERVLNEYKLGHSWRKASESSGVSSKVGSRLQRRLRRLGGQSGSHE